MMMVPSKKGLVASSHTESGMAGKPPGTKWDRTKVLTPAACAARPACSQVEWAAIKWLRKSGALGSAEIKRSIEGKCITSCTKISAPCARPIRLSDALVSPDMTMDLSGASKR